MALENNQIENSNIDNDEISLKELIVKIKEWLTFLISKWKIIFLTGIIGGIIGLTIALFDRPIYKAVLTFAMEDDKASGGSGLSGALGLANSFGIDLGGSSGGAFAATNIAELMKSRLLVEKVLLNPIQIENKLTTLADYYIDINNIKTKWHKKTPNIENINFTKKVNKLEHSLLEDSCINEIYKLLISKENLSILQKDKKVTILTIEVLSNNEKFSKLFCENLAYETSKFYIDTKSKKSKTNVDVLQKQVDSVRNALNGAISGVALEIDNVYNLNPAINKKGTSSKKRQIDVQANTIILTNLSVQLELAKITLRKETPLIQLIDTPILPLEFDKLSKSDSLIIGYLLGTFLSIIYLISSSFISKNLIN